MEKKRMIKLPVRIGMDERSRLADMVIKTGKTRSVIVRELINNGFVKPRLTEQEVKISLQLIGMANNLNQLAKKMNQLKTGETEFLVLKVRDKVNELIKAFDI